MEKTTFFELCRRLAVVTEMVIPDVWTREDYHYTIDQEIKFLHYMDQIIMDSGWSKEDLFLKIRNSGF